MSTICKQQKLRDVYKQTDFSPKSSYTWPQSPKRKVGDGLITLDCNPVNCTFLGVVNLIKITTL